jgi:hypothetical protein
MYRNGEVPTSLLVQRPSAGKDPCLMMPGTAALRANQSFMSIEVI